MMEQNNNKLIKQNESTSVSTNVSTSLLHLPDITLESVEKSNLITQPQKEIILACANNKKIRELDLSKQSKDWNRLVKIIAKAIWDSGINMSKEEQQLIIGSTIEELCNDFNQLTIEEVAIALKNGSRQRYGDFYGINLRTINIWLETYIETSKREAMVRVSLLNKKSDEKVVSEEEKKLSHDKWIENVYKEFEMNKNSGKFTFYDFNNLFYDYAEKIGLIKLSKEDKNKIWNDAINQLKKEHKLDNAKNQFQRAEFSKIIENINNGETKSLEDTLRMKAKRIAVYYLFRNLIAGGKSLKEEVEKLVKNEN